MLDMRVERCERMRKMRSGARSCFSFLVAGLELETAAELGRDSVVDLVHGIEVDFAPGRDLHVDVRTAAEWLRRPALHTVGRAALYRLPTPQVSCNASYHL